MASGTEFKFYIQLCEHYDSDPSYAAGEIDLEKQFGCKYQKFEGLMEMGDVQNIYTETFVDAVEPKLYIPEPSELTHATTEVKLSLLWLSDEDYAVQQKEYEFQKLIFGRKLIYTDNFRKKFWSLLMQKQPSKGEEKLYGSQQYRQVTYTFTNLAGKPYESIDEIEK